MRVLAHPFRLDSSGRVATVEQWSGAQRDQLVLAIVSTCRGERTLAPVFGIADPVGRVLGADEVRAAVELCEPDIRVTGVEVTGPTGSRVGVKVSTVWRADEVA
jgi:hypothetical protein